MGYENCTGRPEEWNNQLIEAEGIELLAWLERDGNVFAKEFANQRGYHSSRFTEWCQQSKTFQLIYSRAKEIQEVKLLKGGLHGTHKEQMSKFVLVNHHDYKEKSELSASIDGKLSISTVDYSKAE